MLDKPGRRILILTDDNDIELALAKMKTLKSQPSCLIWQISHTPIIFNPVPSKILLPHFPAHMTAAIPLLEDYKVASRLCGIEAPGFWEGNMANLLQQYGKTIFPAYEEVFLYGNKEFIENCKIYTDHLTRTP